MSQELDDCGCCSSIEKITPQKITNPSGLSSIMYRCGKYSQFLATMHANLSSKFNKATSQVSLAKLTTREDDDLTIALLDSYAIMSDVLSFYQERLANEGFLQTATERRSVLELARLIGYELRPGVSASTFLVFTTENSPSFSGPVTIDVGTKVQSIPGPGEKPQVFETSEKIFAKPEWNNIKLKLTQKQIDFTTKQTLPPIYFKGVNTKLKVGDGLLIVITDPTQEGRSGNYFRIVTNVEINQILKQTIVHVVDIPQVAKIQPITFFDIFYPEFYTLYFNFFNSPQQFYPFKSVMSDSDFRASCISKGLDPCDFAEMINQGKQQIDFMDNIYSKTTVFAFRIKTALFGSTSTDSSADNTNMQIYQHPDTQKILDNNPNFDANSNESVDLFLNLENTFPTIVKDSSQNLDWCVLKDKNGYYAFTFNDVYDTGLANYFAINGKSTRLTLPRTSSGFLDYNFNLRSTSVFAQSEKLELDDIPISDPSFTVVKGDTVDLDGILCDLAEGQLIYISGELVDDNGKQIGMSKGEITAINSISFNLFEVKTSVTLQPPLQYQYKPDSVAINANIARADHGESKTEVLGSGQPSLGNQEFVLSQNPLTFTSSPTQSGVKSSLAISIDNITWKETSSLCALQHNDKSYVVRIDDDKKVHVKFGNGVNGALPTAGVENIAAKYRIGIGSLGMLQAGQLSMLVNKPLGIESVTNPLPPTGAADPEEIERARQNAPSTVLSMGQIVSLKDFEDFALAFAGIGKAKASNLYFQGKIFAHLTIASYEIQKVDRSDELYINLVQGIGNNKDYGISFLVDSFQAKPFDIKAEVMVSSDRQQPELVFSEVKKALLDKFSLYSRQFGQPVFKSEIVSVIQQVDGIVAVNVTGLSSLGNDYTDNDVIPSNLAHVDSEGNVQGAELVFINTCDIVNMGAMQT